MSKPAFAKLLAGLAGEVASVPTFQAALASVSALGDVWYVDSVNGSDTANDGRSLDSAYATIATAVAAAAAGDTILIRGSFSEEVTVSKAGLRLIGFGNAPKQTQWTADADEICLSIEADYVLVQNIYFRPPAYGSDRGTCAIQLSGANYAQIIGCRFQGKAGSQAAIYSPVCDSDNVEIADNEFIYMNTLTYGAAIVGVSADASTYGGWRILRNEFKSCVIGIDLPGRSCLIQDNTFAESGLTAAGAMGAVCTKMLDLSGTTTGVNRVCGNHFENGFKSTLMTPGTSFDDWTGNWPQPEIPGGRAWFVDSAAGSATNDGKTLATPMSTIALAVAAAAAGDTIFIRGTGFDEAVTCNKAGVRFIGAAPDPAGATWTCTASPSPTCLTLTAIGCEVKNIKFRPPAYAASGTPNAISMSGAHQTKITDCLFQGRASSYNAIYTDGNNSNVLIARNRFIYLNTATYGCAIAGGGYTVGENSGWVIEDNIFHSNVIHVQVRLRQSVVRRNLFGDYGLGPTGAGIQTTIKLNISGATGGWNHVYDNQMEGDYSTTANTYVAGTNDSWYGNQAEDTSETEVTALEVTSAVPAS